MKFSLLTYNLLYNKAAPQLQDVLSSHHPDLVFFQELMTSDEGLKSIENHGYRLADFSNSFIRAGRVFGVATFYNPKVFRAVNSRSFDLQSGFLQALIFILRKGEIPRTVLETEFEFLENKKSLFAYNIHLSPAAMNSVRQRQIVNTFRELRLDKKNPMVIAGDFNFPYKRREFQEIINHYNLKEATKNLSFTSRFLKISPLKLKLDYILYKNLILEETKRINLKFSDHYPIISQFVLKHKEKPN